MDMLALPVVHYLLATVFVLVCILLMLVVLIQKGRGGGLSGAFGGVGGHSAFGAKTGDVFTWITVGLAGAFLLMAVILNFVYVKLPATVAKPAGPPAQQPTPGPTSPGPQEGAPVSGAPNPVPPPRAPAGAVPGAPAPAAPAPVGPAPAQPAPEKPSP